MRLALIAEQFPPLRTSCAVQMRDLALALRDRGHAVTVLVPSQALETGWEVEDAEGVRVVRLRAMETRDRSYAVRMLGELAMPFQMLRHWRTSPAAADRFDGIAWYSPHIFFGPLARALRRQYRCPTYLILRDIFPEWAADVGVMRRGPAYRFLQQVARYQFNSADVIGVQTAANLSFFDGVPVRARRIEVLQNWLRTAPDLGCSIDLGQTRLHGRRIFVYAGNMGVAQGMDKLLRLATEMRNDPGAGFAFVGRGSELARMRETAGGLPNVAFFDEIPPEEIAGLYAQSHVGLVTLDARHRWHNVPGKFISYMHAGLPVLASVNPGSDLVSLIEQQGVGRVSVEAEGADLADLARDLLARDLKTDGTAERCRALAQQMFSADSAAAQLEHAFAPGGA